MAEEVEEIEQGNIEALTEQIEKALKTYNPEQLAVAFRSGYIGKNPDFREHSLEKIREQITLLSREMSPEYQAEFRRHLDHQFSDLQYFY